MHKLHKPLRTFLLAWIVITVITFATHISEHESVHETIFYDLGCERVIIKYGWESTTTCIEFNENITSEEISMMKMLQLQTEIKGYHDSATILAILASAALLGVALLTREEKIIYIER